MKTRLFTIDELADVLRNSPAQIYNIISRGGEGKDIPRSIRVGRRRLWPESEIESWISSQLKSENVQKTTALANPEKKTINRI